MRLRTQPSEATQCTNDTLTHLDITLWHLVCRMCCCGGKCFHTFQSIMVPSSSGSSSLDFICLNHRTHYTVSRSLPTVYDKWWCTVSSAVSQYIHAYIHTYKCFNYDRNIHFEHYVSFAVCMNSHPMQHTFGRHTRLNSPSVYMTTCHLSHTNSKIFKNIGWNFIQKEVFEKCQPTHPFLCLTIQHLAFGVQTY